MPWRPATDAELADLWRIGEITAWRMGGPASARETPRKTSRDVEALPVPPYNSSRRSRHLLITAPGNPWLSLTGENGYLLVVRAGTFVAKVDADGQTWIGPDITKSELPSSGEASL